MLRLFLIGCRNGDACQFLHDNSLLQPVSTTETLHSQQSERVLPAVQEPSAERRRFNANAVSADRVVARPAPQVLDQRTFQINQIKRRYSAREETSPDDSTATTTLHFSLRPSDPDFAFDLPKGLQCVLHVPQSHPSGSDTAKPWLEVKNADMSRGFQLNVERGFRRFVDDSPQTGLLGWMKMLDRDLEALLIQPKADVPIVKFVPNKGSSIGKTSAPQFVATPPGASNNVEKGTSSIAYRPRESGLQNPTFTKSEIEEAAARRQAQTLRLEVRIGSVPRFQKSYVSGVTTYTLPIAAQKPFDMPVPLQGVDMVNLIVPALYPLEHCSIELLGASREAAAKTERGFRRKAMGDGKHMTLINLVNWLAQTMHVLATEPEPEIEQDVRQQDPLPEYGSVPNAPEKKPEKADSDEAKGLVKVIPRPPEWSSPAEESNSDSDLDSDSDDSAAEESETEDHETNLPDTDNGVPATANSSGPERGISINFPDLVLRNIELLELVSLSLTVKCERCKTTKDIVNLRNSATDDTTSHTQNVAAKFRSESCSKCAVPFTIAYRRELMHEHSARAGYLDLTGCLPVDLLPSNFLPTCSSCSTTVSAPGISAVRGPSPAIAPACRDCHAHLSFTLPSLKFQLASQNPSARPRAPLSRRRPKDDKLGIVAGTELPSRGRCEHYSKSYRWFRFSCCEKVFPCDRCHDKESDHPNEHANRMICGYCSREQNYRPEDCGICRASLIKKAGSGFWEGGKGTRDQRRMNRKDPRKFKRRNPNNPVGGTSGSKK